MKGRSKIRHRARPTPFQDLGFRLAHQVSEVLGRGRICSLPIKGSFESSHLFANGFPGELRLGHVRVGVSGQKLGEFCLFQLANPNEYLCFFVIGHSFNVVELSIQINYTANVNHLYSVCQADLLQIDRFFFVEGLCFCLCKRKDL